MAFGFSACSDDDEKGPESSSALIGTWERISCTYQYKENGEDVYKRQYMRWQDAHRPPQARPIESGIRMATSG